MCLIIIVKSAIKFVNLPFAKMRRIEMKIYSFLPFLFGEEILMIRIVNQTLTIEI